MGLLLVGWEGTLEPIPAEEAGPCEAEVLRGWMEEGRRRVRAIEEGSAPLEMLLEGLRRRLRGVYAVSVAAGWGGLTSGQRAGVGWVAAGVVSDWGEGLRLFAARLQAVRGELARWMGEPGEVVWMGAAGGEVHGPEGTGVEVRFARGARLFYKPRAVTGERLWRELQGRLAEVDGGAGVRVGRVLEGRDAAGEFGWMEGLEARPCASGRYWQRAGALLFGSWMTGMGDLHMANIVATAEGPAVVDAECLGADAGIGGGWVTELGRTGLLPGAGEGAEVSGLFGSPAVVAGLQLPRWRGQMVEMVGARLVEQRNRPVERRAPLTCLPEMLEGFRCAAEAMVRLRGELLGCGGWVERVEREHRPRTVRRSTLEYGLAMSGGLLPEVVESERGRAREIRSLLGGEATEEEVRALLRLWVPRSTEDEVRGLRERVAGDVGEGVEEALAGALFRGGMARASRS